MRVRRARKVMSHIGRREGLKLDVNLTSDLSPLAQGLGLFFSLPFISVAADIGRDWRMSAFPCQISVGTERAY